MKTNKIKNIDIFTYQANENYKMHIKTQSKQALEIINKIIDWDNLIKPIEKALLAERSSEPAGRNPYSVLVIVKCFLLQHMYNLSDPRLEEEIADRRSFQIFLETYSDDTIPDETTICRYRDTFSRLGLDKLLFDTFNNQLRAKNMILDRGTLVDATIKQAQATHTSNRDTDARFTTKRGKTTFGYKGHIGVDLGTGVIHSAEMTPANVHDSEMFDAMVHGYEQSVYADKGYANKKRKQDLESNGVFCGILEKGYRNMPLTKQQIGKNKQLSRVRNMVERPFSYMKSVLGYDRCSYYDLSRNRFEFVMKAFVYNIRKCLTFSGAIA